MKTNISAPKNVTEVVVQSNLCVGCGVCAGVCPVSCLEMRVNERGDLQAFLVGKCTSCRLCLKVCPFYEQDKDVEDIAKELFSRQSGAQYRDMLGYFKSCWAGHSTSAVQRRASSSGGLVTETLAWLHRVKAIDAVALVKTCTVDGRYSRFTVVRTVEQIKQCAGSAYYPTEVSDVIREIIRSDERWAVVALPCIAYAIRLAQKKIPRLQEGIKYLISLTCGTLPNVFFTEFLISQSKAQQAKIRRVNYRAKRDRTSPRVFYFEAYDERGTIVGSPVLFSGLASRLWNMGFFRTNACNYCEDVFGETADACFMDAWLAEYDQDPRGENIVVVRNEELGFALEQMQQEKIVDIKRISPEDVIASQKGAIRKKYSSLPIRMAWANARGVWYPRRRVTPRKGDRSKRLDWAIRRRIQYASKWIWPVVGNRLGWRAFLIAMLPWYISLRALALFTKVARLINRLNDKGRSSVKNV